MRKKSFMLLRILCAALTLVLAIGITAPMASALTPEQEQTLQSGQRSIKNPDGTFTVSQPGPILRPFQKGSLAAGQMIIANLLRQLLTGRAEPEFTQIMAYTPIVKAGDALPPQRELSFPDVLKAIFTAGMNNLYIALQETPQEGLYNVIAFYADRKGEVFWTTTGILYDAETGFVQGAEDTGIWGTGYEFDLDQFMSRLPRNNSKRNLGFNIVMDWIAPVALMNLDTVRFPFDYDGKDWMIQFWKGSYYYLSNGAEVALYEKPAGRPLHWDCSDTELEMTMRLYQKDELFFEYGPYRTWWAAAFRYGNPFLMPLRTPKNLRLTGTILFEDKAMLNAFLASFEANKPANMTGHASGLLFGYDWKVG